MFLLCQRKKKKYLILKIGLYFHIRNLDYVKIYLFIDVCLIDNMSLFCSIIQRSLFKNFSVHSGPKVECLVPLCEKLVHSGTKLDFLTFGNVFLVPLCQKLKLFDNISPQLIFRFCGPTVRKNLNWDQICPF